MNQYYSSYHMPNLSKINKIFLITCAAIFILQSLLTLIGGGLDLVSLLGLSIKGISHGYFFELITFPLVQENIISFLFNALVIWMIGSEIEESFGPRLYFGLLLFTIILSGIGYLSIVAIFYSSNLLSSTIPMIGLTGFCSALLIIYSFLYSERTLTFMLLFPMKAKYFCWLLIAMEIYFSLFSGYAKSSWGHLSAMAVGFLYLRYALTIRNLINSLFKPKRHLKSSGGGSGVSGDGGGSRGKGHLKLVRGGEGGKEDREMQSENSSSKKGKDRGDQDDQGPKYWQ